MSLCRRAAEFLQARALLPGGGVEDGRPFVHFETGSQRLPIVVAISRIFPSNSGAISGNLKS